MVTVNNCSSRRLTQWPVPHCWSCRRIRTQSIRWQVVEILRVRFSLRRGTPLRFHRTGVAIFVTGFTVVRQPTVVGPPPGRQSVSPEYPRAVAG